MACLAQTKTATDKLVEIRVVSDEHEGRNVNVVAREMESFSLENKLASLFAPA